MLTGDLGWFDEAQAAGRFGFGYAIRAGVEPGQTAAPVETRWSPDLFDPSGEIRSLLRAMFPDNTMPVRLMEHFIDEGLRRIAAPIDAGETNPAQYLASYPAATDGCTQRRKPARSDAHQKQLKLHTLRHVVDRCVYPHLQTEALCHDRPGSLHHVIVRAGEV
jgi:hypothetical protein